MNRFGVREICDITFKALAPVDINGQHFDAGQPVLYVDTAKTSSLEQAVSTVYAQGGQGNPRLIGWDGEKTLTFTFEDALLSPMSFALLSSASTKVAGKDVKQVFTHVTYDCAVESLNLDGEEGPAAIISAVDRHNTAMAFAKESPLFPVKLDSVGAQSEYFKCIPLKSGVKKFIYVAEPGARSGWTALDASADIDGKSGIMTETGRVKDIAIKLPKEEKDEFGKVKTPGFAIGDTVRIDGYEVHTSGVYEMNLNPESTGGFYYIEASTLFRDEATGQDLPAEFVIPRGKIQSNFTFSMASTGDPSTFTFTVDCFPAFTKFSRNHTSLAQLQVIDTISEDVHDYTNKGINGHSGKAETDVKQAPDQAYTGSVFGGSNL